MRACEWIFLAELDEHACENLVVRVQGPKPQRHSTVNDDRNVTVGAHAFEVLVTFGWLPRAPPSVVDSTYGRGCTT
jgi:hypothetical protein